MEHNEKLKAWSSNEINVYITYHNPGVPGVGVGPCGSGLKRGESEGSHQRWRSPAVPSL